MDLILFQERLTTIAKHRYSQLLMKEERPYYFRYIMKLNYHIKYLQNKEIDKAMEYVNDFEDKQTKRIKDGMFVRPRNMVKLACKDARDVLQAMKRWEGLGVENWVSMWDKPEVNLGRWV